MSQLTPTSSTPSRLKLQTLPLQVLTDSGTDNNVIDSDFVCQANIPTETLPSPKVLFLHLVVDYLLKSLIVLFHPHSFFPVIIERQYILL